MVILRQQSLVRRWNNTFDEDEEDEMKVIVTVKNLLEVKNLPEKCCRGASKKPLKRFSS